MDKPKPADDGGPAFPTTPHRADPDQSYVVGGMTLRDWFAANATEDDVAMVLQEVGSTIPATSNGRAIARYYHADAMLAARKTV